MASQLHIPVDLQPTVPSSTEGLHMPALSPMTPEVAHTEIKHAQDQMIENHINTLHMFYNHNFFIINVFLFSLAILVLWLAFKKFKAQRYDKQKQLKLNEINNRIIQNGE